MEDISAYLLSGLDRVGKVAFIASQFAALDPARQWILIAMAKAYVCASEGKGLPAPPTCLLPYLFSEQSLERLLEAGMVLYTVRMSWPRNDATRLLARVEEAS